MTSSTSSSDANGGMKKSSDLKPRQTEGNLSAIQHLRGQRHLDEDGLRVASGMSSGRASPVPPDAPPSAQSLSAARHLIRQQRKKRLFPTVNYESRVSHFDPRSDYHDFKGFFVLFWIGLAIMVITTALRNIKDAGMPLRVRPWQLFTVGVWQLALSDAAMVLSTLPVAVMAKRFRGKTAFRWAKFGMPIYIIYQAGWLALWVNWPFVLRWTWTAQVFFTLHLIVILMKIHSYSFYNGHLSTIESRLYALDHPSKSTSTAPVERYPSPLRTANEIDQEHEKENDRAAIESITRLRDDLATELISPLGNVTYPVNLTWTNYADYILCPTLCYELEYPRVPEGTIWLELFWKTLAIFGCIFLLTIISEEFIVPVLSENATRLLEVKTWGDQALVLAETVSLLLFPFMITMLLVFLVIFEYVLGAFAEITSFADRHFYSDWWNSCDWLEFSRKWNVPVHHFLRRHVYGASLPYVSKATATALTFFVSAILHELVMGCITKKLRGYAAFCMMLQIPLVALQQSPPLKGKKLFNNVCFWMSIILGLALLCALYVLV